MQESLSVWLQTAVSEASNRETNQLGPQRPLSVRPPPAVAAAVPTSGHQPTVARQAASPQHLAPEPLPQQPVRTKIDLSGQADVDAYILPKAKTIPPFKSWMYLMRNELAAETGRRMFYTDKTGMAHHHITEYAQKRLCYVHYTNGSRHTIELLARKPIGGNCACWLGVSGKAASSTPFKLLHRGAGMMTSMA